MNKDEFLTFLCDLLPDLSMDKFIMHSTASSTTLIVLNRYDWHSLGLGVEKGEGGGGDPDLLE